MRFACSQPGGGHPAKGVEHPHGGGAPRAADTLGGVQRQRKTRVAHGEILRAVVKAAKGAVTRGHTARYARTFLKHRDAVASLQQCAGAGDTCNACTDDGEMFLSGRGVGGLCGGRAQRFGTACHRVP